VSMYSRQIEWQQRYSLRASASLHWPYEWDISVICWRLLVLTTLQFCRVMSLKFAN
jgi:hypothetical protein